MMFSMDNSIIIAIVTQIDTAGAVYGAIKADIKHIIKDLDRHEKSLDSHNTRIIEAHTRINEVSPYPRERRTDIRDDNYGGR